MFVFVVVVMMMPVRMVVVVAMAPRTLCSKKSTALSFQHGLFLPLLLFCRKAPVPVNAQPPPV